MNASTDDSLLFLSTKYPQIKVIKNTSNGGFAKGYNDALQFVKADVFCLLNSDVAVTKQWLLPIRECFENNSDVAIIIQDNMMM